MAVLDLARSEARRRILGLLYADPPREYHLRDLHRRVGMSLGAVQHVVGALEREGLLKRRRLGNLALFSLNSRHPLYREVESTVLKTVGIPAMLAGALAGVEGVRLAFLYGSYVSVFSKSGSAWSAESDVDLMVVGGVDPRRISPIARDAGARTGRQINYTVLGVEELIGKIGRQDTVITEILSKPIVPLAGFGDSGPATTIRCGPKDLSRMLGGTE
jgi:DNA-binding transcriptional ArsR family regulator